MAASGERTLSVWFAGKVAAAINDADGRRLEGLVRMTAGIPQPVVAPLKEALAAEEEAAPETRQVAADKWELFVEAVEDGVRTERMAIAEVVCLHVRSEVLAARNRWTEAFQAEVAAAE